MCCCEEVGNFGCVLGCSQQGVTSFGNVVFCGVRIYVCGVLVGNCFGRIILWFLCRDE